jgi:hypothetical protein
MCIFKGKKHGMIHTMDIKIDHIRAVFFPKNFYEKYKYLGSVPFREEGEYFKAIYPLVLAMDYEAKPKWCPRWVLRFLHLFGSDNSIVRVRNWKLHNLEKKLTGGILLVDWKTKWTDYDLRISIHGPKHLHHLAEAIETKFYKEGYREELITRIKELAPEAKIFDITVSSLEEQLEALQKEID